MGFGEAIKSSFSQYASFNGRACRSEYWFFQLFNGIMIALTAILSFGLLSIVWLFAILLPTFAVTIRRLHDVGKSGWWFLICLVPCVGMILLFIFYCTDSQPGPNQWGPNPKSNRSMNGGWNEGGVQYIEERNYRICPKCGMPLALEDKFCKSCGAQVIPETNIPPVIEQPRTGICPECGTDYGNNVPTFCTSCGHKLK